MPAAPHSSTRARPTAQAFRRCISDVFYQDPLLAYRWTDFLPEQREVDDPFFQIFVKKLYAMLSDEPCLPSARGPWQSPKTLLIPGREQKCGFGEILHIACPGKDFAHDSVRAGLRTEVFMQLGCQQFQPTNELLQCLGVEWWLASQPDNWFVELLEYLFEHVRSNFQIGGGFGEFAKNLTDKLIWPVIDGEEQRLPPPKSTPPPKGALPYQRRDLISLKYAQDRNCPLFYLDDSLDDDELPPGVFVLRKEISGNQRVRKDFLAELGLQPTQRFALIKALLTCIEEHVQQVEHRDKICESEQHEQHVGQVGPLFLHTCCSSLPCTPSGTPPWQVLFILTSLEELVPAERQEAINLCRERLKLRSCDREGGVMQQPFRNARSLYLKTNQLQTLFKVAWRALPVSFLHPSYLASFEDNEKQRNAILEVLQDIGVGLCPKLAEQPATRMHFKKDQEYNWPRTEGHYDVQMYDFSDELSELVQQDNPNTLQEVLRMVDEVKTPRRAPYRRLLLPFTHPCACGAALGDILLDQGLCAGDALLRPALSSAPQSDVRAWTWP